MRRSRYNSGARLDATTIALPLWPVELARIMAAFPGVKLAPAGGMPPGVHPLCIDLWRVSAGRIEVGGRDQHTLAQRAGEATGALVGGGVGAAWGATAGAAAGASTGATLGLALGPLGAAWGLGMGWVAGATLGAAAAGVAGAAHGAASAGLPWRRVSETASRTLGSYHEVLIGLPNAVVGDGPPAFLVLGMYTDNPIALWGDRVLRTGYGKRLAPIRLRAVRQFEVGGEGGKRLVAALRPGRGSPPGLGAHAAWLSQPLLGRPGAGAYALSRLDRALDGVRIAPVAGTVTLSPDFLPGLDEGRRSFRALGARHPWGAFQARGFMARVTDPVPLAG